MERRQVLGAAALVCGAALTGCASTRVVRVEVPVPVPCHAPVIPARPVLPELLATDTPGEREAKKAQALGDALGWGLHLEALLKTVSVSAAPTPKPTPVP